MNITEQVNKLNLRSSCEIDDLLKVMAERMGLGYNKVENMAFDEGVFPESSKVFMTTQFGIEEDEDMPLRIAIETFMKEAGLKNLEITTAI